MKRKIFYIFAGCLLIVIITSRIILGVSHPSTAQAANTTSYTVLTADGYYNSHGDIALLTNGNLLVVYRKGTTHSTDQARVVGKVSADNGVNWSSEFLVLDPRNHPNLNYDAQMPNITVLKTGRILVTVQYTANGGFFQIDGIGYVFSDDFGVTWTRPGYLDSKFTNYARGPGRVAALPNGTLLLPLNGRNVGDQYNSVSYFKSTLNLNGDDWYQPSWTSAETIIANGEVDHINYDEPYLVSLGGSQVLLLMRADPPNRYFYSSHSFDNGVTWTTPVKRFEASGRASVTMLSNGRLLVVTRQFATSYPQVSVYRTSTDGGYFWSPETRLDYDNLANEYGGSIEANGKAYIVYFVEREGAGSSDVRLRIINIDDL